MARRRKKRRSRVRRRNCSACASVNPRSARQRHLFGLALAVQRGRVSPRRVGAVARRLARTVPEDILREIARGEGYHRNPYEIIHKRGKYKGKRARPYLFKRKRNALAFVRAHSYGPLAKSDPYGVRRTNPVLSVIGLPARYALGNPFDPWSLATGLATGAGVGAGLALSRRVLNPRKRRRRR